MKALSIAKTMLCAAFFLVSIHQMQGQSYGNHVFDQKRFNLGMQIGIVHANYKLREDILVFDEKTGTVLKNLEMRPQPGLKLALIANFNLLPYMSLRIIPGVTLEQRNFKYYFENGAIEDRKIEATYLNVPILFQFKSDYYRRSRIYGLAGGQLGINFASNKKVRDDPRLLKINREDFSFVVGAGFNLYGDKIKLSPELTYSMGFSNIFEPQFTTHADAIKSLISQVLTLAVNFE